MNSELSIVRCAESLVDADDVGEGAKVEQRIHITDYGFRLFSG